LLEGEKSLLSLCQRYESHTHTEKKKRQKGARERRRKIYPVLFVLFVGGLTERARKIVFLLSVHRGQAHTPRKTKNQNKK
jgi:hypothetical protein